MPSLSTIRRQRLLSQEDLAKKAGVAERTIHLIETGKTSQPRLKVMRAICQALDVKPEDVDQFRTALDISS